MRITDFLKPLSNFQYSVNLTYDFDDDDKIKSYIPTSNSLDLLEDVLLSTQVQSRKRARLLTGAYGKGKSHFTLALTALLAGKDKSLFENILDKSKSINNNLYKNILEYSEKKKKYFPVIINANALDLRATFLQALRDSLKKAGLAELMPSTFFDAAVQKIFDWKNDFPATYDKFSKSIDDSVDDFVAGLKEYDRAKYSLFAKLHPSLTSGSEFNPMQGLDVIKVYESVADELEGQGYSGIFVVYDEFGKYLEGSSEIKDTMDIKMLQDFAEKCNDRFNKSQLHLFLISHKQIDNYIGKIAKEKVDAFKAVKERFKTVSIESNDIEIYEMVGQVLKKDAGKFGTFIARHKTQFDELKKLLNNSGRSAQRKLGAFGKIANKIGDQFVEQCYPLHPYSMLILPKVSELIAQNERTIFTFLASDEKNTAPNFAKVCKDAFPILEPDIIYDYFEPQFRGEPYGSDIRKQWQIANSAVAKLNASESVLAIKIVKTLALIYIINQFEVLPPSLDLIYEIYSCTYNKSEISRAINLLNEEQLLIELQFKPHVKIKESSGNNIPEMIKEESLRLDHGFNYKVVLQKALTTQYFYPTIYNDEHEITRYFWFDFIEYSDLAEIENIDEYISNIQADGAILAVLLNAKEKNKAIEIISRFNNERIVFVLPKDPARIRAQLLEYEAINTLIKKYSNNDILVDELKYIREDLHDLIDNYIDVNYLKPEHKKSLVYYLGDKIEIARKSELSLLLSRICDNVFAHTPIIVNENINRNSISPQMKTARQKIISNLFERNSKENIGLASSQDINVFRSLFVVTNIISDPNHPVVDITQAREDVRYVLDIINDFFLSSSLSEKCFSILYDRLINPEQGIGLKRGVIPFYIAAVICMHKSGVVIYSRTREIPMSTNLILSINEAPDKYKIKLQNWDVDVDSYISRLETIFSQYLDHSDKEYSVFYFIVNAMQRWHAQLPKFNRETKLYCNDKLELKKEKIETTKIKEILSRPECNAHEVLFSDFSEVFGIEDFSVITRKLGEIKKEVDKNVLNIIKYISKSIMKLLNRGDEVSLSSALLDYYDDLSDATKHHMFGSDAAKFLEVAKAPGNSEEQIVRSLVRKLTTIRIEDFSDEMLNGLNTIITKAKDEIDNYNNETKLVGSTSSGYKLMFENKEGAEQVRQVDALVPTPQTKILYNNILADLEDFGESMTEVEKAQVLLEVLRSILKN